MSDVMLHAVLCMPPDLWSDSPIDKVQRHQRYLEASKRIKDGEKEIATLQAWVDELMLEYCPEAMTKEQVANWANHQKEVS